MAVLDTYITAPYKSLKNSLKDWIYDGDLLQQMLTSIISVVYVALLLWFAHIDLVIDCVNERVTDLSLFANKLVSKHGHFLSLLTNLGLLFILFIDLIIAGRYKSAITLTIVNIIGVASIICIFWFSSGFAVGADAAAKIGAFSLPFWCMYSLAFFTLALLYLKYTSIKP